MQNSVYTKSHSHMHANHSAKISHQSTYPGSHNIIPSHSIHSSINYAKHSFYNRNTPYQIPYHFQYSKTPMVTPSLGSFNSSGLYQQHIITQYSPMDLSDVQVVDKLFKTIISHHRELENAIRTEKDDESLFSGQGGMATSDYHDSVWDFDAYLFDEKVTYADDDLMEIQHQSAMPPSDMRDVKDLHPIIDAI